MTDNPAERLRNLLSPFLNLVSVLTLEQVKIEAENPHLTKLIENDLKVCAQSASKIREYLDQADDLYANKDFNYNELRQRLTDFLAGQSKEDLERWLEFDRKRMENATGNPSKN